MAADDRFPADPFEGLILDDDWVAEAARRELPAQTREAQARWAQADAEQEEIEERRWRRRRRRRRRNRALVLLAILVFALAVGLADRQRGEPSSWSVASGPPPELVLGGRPTPMPQTSPDPLGTPADPDASGGTYRFLQRRADGTPITYDPCRPIEVVVNDNEAPDGTEGMLERAVTRVSEVTGLQMRITGSSDEPPTSRRSAFQPERYGDRWAPVLVAWTDPGEVPQLGGDVAGLGGSVAASTDGGPLTYVSGLVLLDGPDTAEILDREERGDELVEAIILHELGHLVGLDHVASKQELMFAEGQRDVVDYQRGDRAGLTELGRGACLRTL